MLHAACCKCRTQKSHQKPPSGPHPTTLSGYIFATKACINNREKNLLSSNISSTCPHNMVNFGPLAAEIVSLVWGTPGNISGFHICGSITARQSSSGRQPNCGVEQRAPPIFGRVAVTLGIRPHFWLLLFYYYYHHHHHHHHQQQRILLSLKTIRKTVLSSLYSKQVVPLRVLRRRCFQQRDMRTFSTPASSVDSSTA